MLEAELKGVRVSSAELADRLGAALAHAATEGIRLTDVELAAVLSAYLSNRAVVRRV